jgi:hypothetical protein
LCFAKEGADIFFTHLPEEQGDAEETISIVENAWECPERLINTVDDVVFDGFLENCKRYLLGGAMRGTHSVSGMHCNDYCELTPQHLDPAETLADPRWDFVRQKAAAFVAAFSKNWPFSDPVA